MMKKEIRENILNGFNLKEERILASKIIDKFVKCENSNYLTLTCFLDIYEKEIAVNILNKLSASYYVYSPLADTSRFVIFIFPSYLEDVTSEVYENISCIKVIPPRNYVFTHRECMGSIYSLVIKREMIGDIFVTNNVCYFFTFKSQEKYIFQNFTNVSNYEVTLQNIDILGQEIKKININFKNIQLTIPSLRVDVILSSIFNISREKMKSKIESGDLYISAEDMCFVAYL